MSERPCDVCKRPLWDGGHAINERECDEPNGVKCRLLAEVADLRTRLKNEQDVCSKLGDRTLELADEAMKAEAERDRLANALLKTAHLKANEAGEFVAAIERADAAERAFADLKKRWGPAETFSNDQRLRVEEAERLLAEKTAECERLKAELSRLDFKAGGASDDHVLDLAESQAREVYLRTALESAHRDGSCDECSACDGEPCPALALKSDNAALVEVCERVAREVIDSRDHAATWGEHDLKAIVARVLGGTPK